MLVLTRKIEQTIVIGGNTTVSVLGIDRGWISLGFKAPDDVPIRRKELLSSEVKPHTSHKKTEGMLVPTRKVGEGVNIGEDIFVTILGAERSKVKVGVAAPFDVSIKRGELLDESRVHGSKERL